MDTKLRSIAAAATLVCVVASSGSTALQAARPRGGTHEEASRSAAADAARRLAGRAVGETPMIEDLRELCDRIGGRPTGSPACERAVRWAEEKFRAAGIDSVRVEPFTMPNLWLPDRAEGMCVAPEPFPLRIVAAPFSPSTPEGRAIEAPLRDAGEGTAERFARLGERARGAVVLIHTKEMRSFEDLFHEYLQTRDLLEAARTAGAAALLLQSTRPRGLLYRHPVNLEAQFAPLPVATLSREHAFRLARLAERGEVRVRLALSNRTGGAYESKNVIAEIRGRERPDEIVLLGAHLDSWDLGTGAEDNGVNDALVIDVARAFAQLQLVPRRTVRFALFTGEEQGMLGSAAYVRSHSREMDGHVAVVIFDIGSGRTTGFYLNGREELRQAVTRALSAVSGLGVSDSTIEAVDGTDNFDFLLSGVPNLVAAQDPAPYLPNYHAESDVFEMVNPREAQANAAIAAELMWSLAESPDRPARRQSREQVEKLLSDRGLVEQMKAFGQWDDWEAGRRGVSR